MKNKVITKVPRVKLHLELFNVNLPQDDTNRNCEEFGPNLTADI